MTTLITGGAGFIGSHLARRLLSTGEPIIILDNLDSYYDPALKRRNLESVRTAGDFEMIEGDIRDGDVIAHLFQDHTITRVAHMAAMSGVRYSAEHGALYAAVNTLGTVNLLDAARKAGISVFVQSSTSSVYGAAAQVPFVETDPAVQPLAPYPASKRAAEMFAYSYHQLYDLNVNILRFFNVYGPYGRPDMMPMRVLDLILHDKPIPVFGDGTMRRDWTYIDDIVNGVVAALERPMGFQTFNLGYGAPITLNRFIEIYEALVDKKAQRIETPTPATEPPITYCDNTRARERLGFAPQVDIVEGLVRTWTWYQEQMLRTE